MKLSDLPSGAVFHYPGQTQRFYVAPWTDACPINRRGLLAVSSVSSKDATDVVLIWSPTEVTTDQVDRPAHYVRLKPEPIEVIQSWGLNFVRGNAVKYIVRAGHKPGADEVTDLRKAIANLQKEVVWMEAKK